MTPARLSDERLREIIDCYRDYRGQFVAQVSAMAHELLAYRAAEAQRPTCATCKWHNQSDPLCDRGIGRPNYIDPVRRVDQFSFGCTLHEPLPPTP